MTTLAPDRPTVASSPPRTTAPARSTSRGQADTLAIAWIHGRFEAATFRRTNLVSSWQSDEAIASLEELGTVLDSCLPALNYRGTDVILLLAHEQFTHQTEPCPSFSESATRAYLRGLVERHDKEFGPALSVTQRVASVRKEAQHLIHFLPQSFYHDLNNLLLARHLDLSRIIPANVPLELELSGHFDGSRPALLLATELGNSTAVIACRENGEILLSRTTLGNWRDDPGRVAVEVNRSLLYAKQQHAADIDRIILIGDGAAEAQSEIESKCGEGKTFVVQETQPVNWLTAAAKLPLKHPVNLIAGYLNKKRRNHFLRGVILASCWFVFTLLAFETWSQENDWSAEQARLAALRSNEEGMHQTYDRLIERNAEADRNETFIRQVMDDRLPPVPDRFLAYVASVIPREVQLNQFLVTFDGETDKWTFRIDGMLEADPETARNTISSVRRQLGKSPFRVQFTESVRREVELSLATEATVQRFNLEGGLFEF